MACGRGFVSDHLIHRRSNHPGEAVMGDIIRAFLVASATLALAACQAPQPQAPAIKAALADTPAAPAAPKLCADFIADLDSRPPPSESTVGQFTADARAKQWIRDVYKLLARGAERACSARACVSIGEARLNVIGGADPRGLIMVGCVTGDGTRKAVFYPVSDFETIAI